jgi:hypothetical protein
MQSSTLIILFSLIMLVVLSCFNFGIQFSSRIDVAWLIDELLLVRTLGASIVCTSTSKYVFTSIGLSSL